MGRLTKIQMLKALVWPWAKNQMGLITPYGFFLMLTSDCNKRCGYCAVTDNGGHHIDLGVAMKAIDVMYAKGCRYIGLMGGEPLLLAERLVAIIKYATEKGMITYLPTNLSLLTSQLLSELVEAGVTVIDVAVDTTSATPCLPKNMSLIRKNLDLLLGERKKVIVKLNTTITKKNTKDVREIVEIAHSLRIPISLHLVEGFKSSPHGGNDLLFQKQDLLEVKKISEWLKKKQSEGYWITNSQWYWREMAGVVRGGHNSFQWGCPAKREKTMLIDEYGKFYPCLSLKGKGKYGDIFTGKIKKEVHESECNSCLSCINTKCSELDSSLFAVAKFLWKFF